MNREPLLYDLRPVAAQVRAASSVALLITLAFVGTLAFRNHRLAAMDSFIPVSCAVLLLAHAITAMLLLAQAVVLRSQALLALGTGFFFTALIIVPRWLTFPGAFSPDGLLGAGPNSTIWLYFFWHCGLPVSAVAFALLKDAPAWSSTVRLSPQRAVALCLVLSTASVGGLALLATAGGHLLPQIMIDLAHRRVTEVMLVSCPVALIVVAAMIVIWHRRSSVLDLWLLLLHLAWLAELLLTNLSDGRFTLGWYSGRMIQLLSGLFVLLMLLAQTSSLYMRAVLQVRARLWEQENRLMIRDAVTASVTHELRQPLSAIMLNAEAAQALLHKPDKLYPALTDILADAHRANDIVEGTRALFNKSVTQKRPANINQLIRETLTLVSREIRDRGISMDIELDASLRRVSVNRLQIEQVLFNLFMNAAEAMSAGVETPCILTIETRSTGTGVLIGVEDTGQGISAEDQERIFDIFYTTKRDGTGVGLSICRSIISAHGGTLTVAAKKVRGVRFEIRLPFDSIPERLAPADTQVMA